MRRYWSIGVLAATMALLQVLAPSALRYEREAVLDGAIWRAFSGHLVHLGWAHLGLNLAALLVLAFGFGLGAERPGRFWLRVSVLATGVAAGLLVASPQVSWYVGFSGILHGLVVVAAAADWERQRWISVALLGGLTVKLVAEQLAGAPAATAQLTGGAVVVDAHLYGAITGAALALAERVRRVSAPPAGPPASPPSAG